MGYSARNDKVGEQLVASFLQQHLYGGKYGLVKTRKALSGGFISRFEPQKGEELQTKGVDVTFVLKDEKDNFLKKVAIDEKTAIYYPKISNNSRYLGLPTFAFELESGYDHTGAGFHKGWLLKDDLLTDYYLVNWVTLEVGNHQFEIPQAKWHWWKSENIQKYDLSIDSIESCLLDRSTLRSFVLKVLNENGIDSYIYNNPRNFKEFMNSRQSDSFELGGKVHLKNNNSLPEKPINIVIPKNILIDSAVIHAFSYASRAPKIYE